MWHLPKTYFHLLLVFKSFSDCCDCNRGNSHSKDGNNSQSMPGKRELEIKSKDQSLNVLNETHFELHENEFNTNDIYNESMNPKEFCSNFKNGAELDIEKMIDVWQIVYYQMAEILPCFKIHIRKTTNEDKKMYAEKYGDFNGAVNWNECNLELLREKNNSGRKHFLQGTHRDLGVLENIVMSEKNEDNLTTASIHHEAPDQWMVVKNLLLMRDCDSGDIVIFTRFPQEPRSKDIIDALEMFGEEIVNGTMACDEGYRIYRYIKPLEIEN